MTVIDVTKLQLEEPWMYERFIDCISRDLGPAYIVEEGVNAICAFGALFEWGTSGACEVWFNLIEHRRTLDICRIVKRLLVSMAERHGITRMQAIVKCGNKVNNRFMRFLGFENETPNGMKNKLYNGETAFMYSRCF